MLFHIDEAIIVLVIDDRGSEHERWVCPRCADHPQGEPGEETKNGKVRDCKNRFYEPDYSEFGVPKKKIVSQCCCWSIVKHGW